MSNRTVTRTIESEAEPDSIFAILIRPELIPQWAPAFADRVEPDGEGGGRVTKDGGTFPIQVVIGNPNRTVDYLREIAPGKRNGAYIRVLNRPGGGSVVVMTLPVPAGGDAEKVAKVLSQELEALVALGQAHTKPQ